MSTSEEPLHIDIPVKFDIPVKLTEEEVMFSVGALTFEGDLPASIFHLQLPVDIDVTSPLPDEAQDSAGDLHHVI